MLLRNIEQVGSYWNVGNFPTVQDTYEDECCREHRCCGYLMLPSLPHSLGGLHSTSLHPRNVWRWLDCWSIEERMSKWRTRWIMPLSVSKSLYSSQHVLMMDLLTTIMIMITIVHKKCNVRENSDRRQIQQGWKHKGWPSNYSTALSKWLDSDEYQRYDYWIRIQLFFMIGSTNQQCPIYYDHWNSRESKYLFIVTKNATIVPAPLAE